MVIFHSYVSLPEGNPQVVAQSLRGEVNKVALTAFIPAVVEVVATTTTSTTSSSVLAVQRMVGDATGG
jgi:hypothetical protein